MLHLSHRVGLLQQESFRGGHLIVTFAVCIQYFFYATSKFSHALPVPMPLKLLFVLTLSVALGFVVSRYIGWQYPLSTTSTVSLNPDLAKAILVVTEVVWTISNVYATNLLYRSWHSPPGFVRVSIATFICVLFYAQYFLGFLAYRDLDEFSRNVPGPWLL